MVLRVAAVLTFTTIWATTGASAQSRCFAHWRSTGSPYAGLDRSLQLAGELPLSPAAVVRSGWTSLEQCAAFDTIATEPRSIEFAVLPAFLVAENNSVYPRQHQDGLRWAGRGLSATFSAGAAARTGPVTAALLPVVAYQENAPLGVLLVPTPGYSPYASYFHTGEIDRPQRFGTSSSVWAHPGQSFLRVDAFGTAAGVSTENLQWGPARRNPIVMSGAAAGFPHVFVGTSRPLDLRIVQLTAEAVWGRLEESDYYDTLSVNDRRLFAGFVATLTPGGSGLTLGFTRAYLRTIPPDGLSLADEVFGPYLGIRDNPADDVTGDNQLLSVFFSWASVESGFEAYAEYAREDHWEDFEDLLMQLDHSRGYTVGVEKVYRYGRPGHRLRVGAEATNLGNAPTFQSGRPGGTFYTHHQVVQGYTHRGQLLGAPIGPGADAQYVGTDYMAPQFLAGLYVTRTRYDNDTYYRHFAHLFSNRGHDTEWTLGLRGGTLLQSMQVLGEVALSNRYNRDFIRLYEEELQLDREMNFSITLGAAWVPGPPRSDR